jgi:hypothetical protein
LAVSAVRVSRNVGSSGVSPAGVLYEKFPEGVVNVCGPIDACAPLADGPVNASTENESPRPRSTPKPLLTKNLAVVDEIRSCSP